MKNIFEWSHLLQPFPEALHLSSPQAVDVLG